MTRRRSQVQVLYGPLQLKRPPRSRGPFALGPFAFGPFAPASGFAGECPARAAGVHASRVFQSTLAGTERSDPRLKPWFCAGVLQTPAQAVAVRFPKACSRKTVRSRRLRLSSSGRRAQILLGIPTTAENFAFAVDRAVSPWYPFAL